MKLAAKKNKILSAIMTCVLAITLMAGFPAVKAYAASGTVYSCAINRCYAHPVTGVIEDSGGESSYATGQGMVEGAVYGSGLMELLKQPLSSPLSLHEQVITLCAATHKAMMHVETKKMKKYQRDMLDYFDSAYPEIGREIEEKRQLPDELAEKIVKVAEEFADKSR